MSVTLDFIPQTDTLKYLLELVNEYVKKGIIPDEIVIGFDCDGTLTNLSPPALKNTPNERLRGGSETRDVFNKLNELGIKWFVISARPVSKSSMIAVMTTITKLELDQTIALDKTIKLTENVLEFRSLKYNAIESGNIISLFEPGSKNSFDKDVSMKYAIKKYFKNYPKLAIFIDDNAKNALTLFYYFQEIKNEHPDTHFVSILYDPVKKEDDHDDYMQKFKELFN